MALSPPRLAVGAIVVHHDAVLLVERATAPSKGLWTVPGGKVEPGERMASAVAREVREETGLAVEAGDLVGWVERMGRDFHFVIMDFEAELLPGWDRSDDGHPRLTPCDDAADAAWVALARLPDEDHPLVPGLLEFLRDHNYL